MRSNGAFAAFLAALVMGALTVGLDAVLDTPRTLMSSGDYARAGSAIAARTQAALGHCRRLEGGARRLCQTRAYANERIAKADLEERYYGTEQAAAAARDQREHARWQLARARCAGTGATELHQCLDSARADKAKDVTGLPVSSS